jgi:beta-phosphoglucomutase-like phosphatase (HAD superfamily)
MIPTEIDALVFDVDGTLAETEEAHRLSFNEAFAEAGLPWLWSEDDYRHLLKVTGGKERIAHYLSLFPPPEWGGTGGEAARVGPAAAARALHARKTEIYTARVAAGAVAFRPGIEDLISEARRRGVALAIATTTSRPNVDALLGAVLGPESPRWFKAIACGDMVTAKKPAPDVYELALRELGVPAARAVAIEDSWNGLSAARAAGLAVIATPSLYCAEDDFSDATIVTTPERIAAALGWSR